MSGMDGIIGFLFSGIGLTVLGLLLKAYFLSPREKPFIEVNPCNDLQVGTYSKTVGLSVRNLPYVGKLAAFVKREKAENAEVRISVVNEMGIPVGLAQFRGIWEGSSGSTQMNLVPSLDYHYVVIARKKARDTQNMCEFIGSEIVTNTNRTWNLVVGQYRVGWELHSSGRQVAQGQLILTNPESHLEEFLLRNV